MADIGAVAPHAYLPSKPLLGIDRQLHSTSTTLRLANLFGFRCSLNLITFIKFLSNFFLSEFRQT